MQTVVAQRDGRIDKVLSQTLGCSRNQIEQLIDAGCVKIDGALVLKRSFRVSVGQKIEYRFIKSKKDEKREIDFDIDILFEDEDILVVNKPPNLVVHPAPSVKEPTVVDWLISKGISVSTISGKERYGIVHRIDKDTTGALVIAKSNKSHIFLSDILKRKEMGRYYIALIDHPLKESVTIDKPIGRNPKNRLKMGIIEGGRDAKSDFLKIAQSVDVELVGVRLHTGRTHQIRVHLNSINRHILGDTLYGYRGRRVFRTFLHARFLYLIHPISGERMEIEAPLFSDMRSFILERFDRRVVDEALLGKNLHDSFINHFGTI